MVSENVFFQQVRGNPLELGATPEGRLPGRIGTIMRSFGLVLQFFREAGNRPVACICRETQAFLQVKFRLLVAGGGMLIAIDGAGSIRGF
jgi:hypothetical protein